MAQAFAWTLGTNRLMILFVSVKESYNILCTDSTPEELARLCGQGPDGWLCSSHITWLLDRVNEAQNTALFLCLSAADHEELLRLLRTRDASQIERLVFIANVGKNCDNSVYLATPQKSGSHWVLITIDLTDHPVINYCDGNGWHSPPDLLLVLVAYTKHFGLLHLHNTTLRLMHQPTLLGYNHFCMAECKNYPLQSCGNVCGLVAVIGAAIAALDTHLFSLLTGPASSAFSPDHVQALGFTFMTQQGMRDT